VHNIPSRSSKIDYFYLIWKGLCNFLWVICNYCLRYGQFSVETRTFSLPLSFHLKFNNVDSPWTVWSKLPAIRYKQQTANDGRQTDQRAKLVSLQLHGRPENQSHTQVNLAFHPTGIGRPNLSSYLHVCLAACG